MKDLQRTLEIQKFNIGRNLRVHSDQTFDVSEEAESSEK
jgi:hypothetical protein